MAVKGDEALAFPGGMYAFIQCQNVEISCDFFTFCLYSRRGICLTPAHEGVRQSQMLFLKRIISNWTFTNRKQIGTSDLKSIN